jgi:hypothetical protein
MAVLILRFDHGTTGWTNPAQVNDAVRMSLAKLIGGGLPTHRYVRVKEADQVNPTAFVTGAVTVCDGFCDGS